MKDSCKVLYISSIFKKNSFGEQSKCFIDMMLKRSDWEIYLFHISSTKSFVDKNMLRNDAKEIRLIPDYSFKSTNEYSEFNHFYLSGLFHLRRHILDILPDVVLMMYNDNDLQNYAKEIKLIKKTSNWKGKFIPYLPIELTYHSSNLFSIDCDEIMTMYKISESQVGSKCKVTNIPLIVDTIKKHDKKQIKRKLYGNLCNKYVVGLVNANSYRKRLDLSFETFNLFSKKYPNSLFVVKTTVPDLNNNVVGTFSDIFRYRSENVIIISRHLTKEELNELYSSFDIMISTSDSEGFGLTPFEAAMAGTLTILPNHTSFKSILYEIENKTVEYSVKCKKVPYQYSHNIENYSNFSTGKANFCIYKGILSVKNSVSISKKFIENTYSTNLNTSRYYITKLPKHLMEVCGLPTDNLFSNIEDVLNLDWNQETVCIYVTSDIETVQYIHKWLSENKDTKWKNKRRNCQRICDIELGKFISEKSPQVWIANPEDVCAKLEFYYKNKDKYDDDLFSLQKYIQNNFSEEAVWGILRDVISESSE